MNPRPSLELSMIVRNAAATLPRCLASVRGLAQRIVIGDTGSTDHTRELALAYGAEVISIPWTGDFAQARNAVLAHATQDWLLVLDADEMLDPAAHEIIPTLLADPAVFAYQTWIWNYVHQLDYRCGGQQAMRNPLRVEPSRPWPAYVRSLNTRLFRRHPDIYFEHPVHESITHRLDAAGRAYQPAGFLIHHFGYVEDAEAERARKNQAYYEMTLEKAAASPAQYQAQLEAGISELDHARRPSAALPYLERACSLAPRQPAAWLYAGLCHTRLGAWTQALPPLQRAVALDAHNPLAWRALGDVYFHTAHYPQACTAYHRARERGAADALSLAKLGAAEIQSGDKINGLARIRQAIREHPDAPELYDILAGSAFLAGQPAIACNAADHRLTMPGVQSFHYQLAATLHRHTGNESKALAIQQAGTSRFPE